RSLSVTCGFHVALRMRGPFADVRGGRNAFAMRIFGDVREVAFQLADGFFTEDVLDLFGVLVDVVGGNLGGVGEIQFPEPVIADDRTGKLPAGRREKDHVAFLVQRDEAMAAQILGLPFDVLDGFAPALAQFTQRDTFTFEITRLEHVIDGLQRVLTLNTPGARTLTNPTNEEAMAGTKKKCQAEY